MTLTLAMVTIDTTDALSLGRWWAEQVGGSITQENDGYFVVVRPPAGPLLGFQKVEDPTPGKNRVHLDLTAEEIDTEVERLVAAGATRVGDREMEGMRWVTLADPDGNQFCIAAH